MRTRNDARRRRTTAQLASLTLANAFIFHAELAEVDSRISPLRVTINASDPITALADQWQLICAEINYVPIFSLALDVLNHLPQRADTFTALRALAHKVLSVVANRAALRHDLMGRIYHYLLLDAKYLGTYYTSVPSATLLLKLTLRPSKWTIGWNDLDALGQLRVADLASGTGTLLMAAQQAITDNFIHATTEAGHSVTEPDLKSLHKVVMEEILHGYDVLSSAIHLTASTLALLAPDVAFHRMHLYCMPLGVQSSGAVNLGSIEYLEADTLTPSLDLMGEEHATQVTGTGDIASYAPLPELDLCVMNPPFVRSVGGNLLFGSLPEPQRKEMQKKLSRLLKRSPGQGGSVLASSTAGLGSVFVAVGDRRLKPGGRMALVLPEALGFGVAWEKTRQLLSQSYVVELLIVSHDPERWNFSENTDLSEILVIARKRKRNEAIDEAKTICINLWSNTTSIVDALALADAIERVSPAEVDGGGRQHGVASVKVGDTKRGEAVQLDWSVVKDEQWYPCAFAQTDLVRVAHFLRHGQAYFPGSGTMGAIPLVRLDGLGVLGPDARDIADGFATSDSPTAYPALWSHSSARMTTIEAVPNKFLEPRNQPLPGRPRRSVDLLWPKSGRVMLAERLRLTSQCLTAVRLPELALSNSWWPLRLWSDDERHEKALVLWQNSTLGIINLVSHRVPTEGPWGKFKKPHLEALPVLHPGNLTNIQLQSLAEAYDTIAQSSLLPLPQMAQDPTRAVIDAAVVAALGLPPLDTLRQTLAREPIVCGVSLCPRPSATPQARLDLA